MRIRFNINKKRNDKALTQNTVDFFYGYGNLHAQNGVPTQRPYLTTDTQEGLIVEEDPLLVGMNYTNDNEEVNGQQMASPAGISQGESTTFQKASIYKREVWDGGGESVYSPVALDSTATGLYDYNIANNRSYEYMIYPEFASKEGASLFAGASTNWQNWSLTELHPVVGQKKQFTASNSDVWIFKYNVEPAEQTQNISKTQQDNLTAYPKFSHGLKNNIGSSITCLLGSEMVPFTFVTSKKEYKEISPGVWGWKTVPISPATSSGGYTEQMPFTNRLTSNQRIDMLNAWRQVAFSGNPKLIKDRKGQKFLVQITGSSNTTQDTWTNMPDTISFTWVEIGSLEGVTITSPIN